MNEHLTYHEEIEYWKDVYKNKIRFASKNDSSVIPWDIKTVDLNLKKLLEDLDLNKGDLLELGCGTGYDARYLSEKGFNVTAIDVSEEAIDLAKKNHKNYNINFIVADFFNGSATCRYDIVYDRGFSHNYKDRLFEIFEKVYNLLNDEGKLIIIGGNPNQPVIETCTPPPLFLGEIEYHSSQWFKVIFAKEIVFKTDENYNDCLGYIFYLKKRHIEEKNEIS
jgi:SAM-dependent methyltransferase